MFEICVFDEIPAFKPFVRECHVTLHQVEVTGAGGR